MRRLIIIKICNGNRTEFDQGLFIVIKDCLSYILPALTELINSSSFSNSVFPKAWKKSEVVPHLKDGDHEIPSNNRPISLLPVLSKVTEKIALNQFTEYLTQQGNLTCHQSGNRKFHSTETLSLLVTGHIYKAMDKTEITAMVLIDLSKAFDSICHRTLLTKLKGLGTSITNRMQSTRLGTSRSIELTVTHGVPQGSILGPLLFSLYMNDLPSVVKFSRVESYVDDTKVYLSCSKENINSRLAKVSEDLRLIASWCCTNKLLNNSDKTKLILFGTKLLLSKFLCPQSKTWV